MNAQNLHIPEHLQGLFAYLWSNGFIRQIEDFRQDYLKIFSRDALEKIRTGDHSWEVMVPEKVVNLIKERGMLGHKAPASE